MTLMICWFSSTLNIYIYNQDGGHKRRLLSFFFSSPLGRTQEVSYQDPASQGSCPFFFSGGGAVSWIYFLASTCRRRHLRETKKEPLFISLREISSKWVLFITHVERYSLATTHPKKSCIYTRPLSIRSSSHPIHNPIIDCAARLP